MDSDTAEINLVKLHNLLKIQGCGENVFFVNPSLRNSKSERIVLVWVRWTFTPHPPVKDRTRILAKLIFVKNEII